MDKLIEELDEKDTKEEEDNKDINKDIKGGKTEESKTFKSMN